MWKKVTFHADEETIKILEELTSKNNRSQFIRVAIKFYQENALVLNRIEEKLARMEERLNQNQYAGPPIAPVETPELLEQETPQADARFESVHHILAMIGANGEEEREPE